MNGNAMANKYCAKYICHVPVYKCSLYCTQFSRLSKKGPPFCNERTFAISLLFFLLFFFSIFQLFTLFLVNVFKINFKSTIRKMHIESIPMRWGHGDNYAYLVVDTPTKQAWLIDSAQPDEVLEYFKKHKTDFNLKAIVNTHHHYDHSDGNPFFHKKYPDLPIIAGKDSPLVTYTPSDKETLELERTSRLLPCTLLAIHKIQSVTLCKIRKLTRKLSLLVILFISGCGRFFEGTGKEMNYSLNQVLAKLPKETKVYPP